MPRLCCFLHPRDSGEDRSLEQLCPECNRPFGFMLTQPPVTIKDYRIVTPIDRGFYSAAYIAETGPFDRHKVIKVAFKKVYDYFGKDFARECRDHARAAENSQHIVNIDNMLLDVPITFGDVTEVCHVAEMDFVNGATLRQFLKRDKLSAATIAQIAIDLFAILQELDNKRIYHNDLHAANLMVEELPDSGRRPDAEDESVRLVAIDLNSVSDNSKSDPDKQRLSDLHWVVRHLQALVDRLLSDPEDPPDLEYRLATVLQERIYLLSPEANMQRVPTFAECIEDVHAAVRQVSSTWREPPRLRRFNDAYNAQTLAAWFVPYLLVDPDERWLSAIGTPGPQVITGMRGCGKTMLLRALQFHARATIPSGESSPARIMTRLRDDGYLGLYVSCTRLLDKVGNPSTEDDEPYARLYVSYALEALRAARHLRELDRTALSPSYYQEIGRAIADYVKGADAAGGVGSESHLERLLLKVMVRISRGDKDFSFTANPSEAFPHLAEAISKCSPVWSSATVLYLLDDVSTRYLAEPRIQQLMSSLLFPSPRCAFKLTTEAQTLETILRSPGQIERARAGRDYDVFDLGAEVNDLIKRRPGGKEFVERVLTQRAKYYPNHPKGVTPAYLLGDVPLETVAERIGATSATSNERKSVYSGLSVLAGICVGDIGDVISIYEMILRKAVGKAIPVDPKIQCESYQEFCSRRLYELNRRKSDLKDFALSFAEASHELLMQSYRDTANQRTKRRLRQYLKLYVRLTKGDTELQFQQLRELIDAGVFVLDGGAYRTKTRDSNPIQQFKLTFRKLYGVSNFIGLAERDRFELSGDDLIEWLRVPRSGNEVLLRNLAHEDEEEPDVEQQAEMSSPVSPPQDSQLSLFAQAELIEAPEEESVDPKLRALIAKKMPACQRVSAEELSRKDIDGVVFGLGFEERTLESVSRLIEVLRPQHAILVKYPEPGNSEQIIGLVKRSGIAPDIVEYADLLRNGLVIRGKRVLVDVTGLAKPVIFHAVRACLKKSERVWVCHTQARSHYPLDDDIAVVLNAQKNRDYHTLLEGLRSILTGEHGPYSIDGLLMSDADESRRRVLLAFSSPKHERLVSLLDERTYDRVEIVSQDDSTPRGAIAKISAEFAAENYRGASVTELGSDDIEGVLSTILQTYYHWYVDSGFNFELGLTGSKLQAVACAAVAAAFKVAQCWYVRPAGFDPKRFTVGIGPSEFFEISLPTKGVVPE